jgi:lipoprotein
MKLISKFLAAVVLASLAAISFQACDKGKSYAELLNDENMAVNRFLSENKVVTSIPADSVFEVGPDAPYYQLDEDGNVYMQVLDPGSGEKVEESQLVYFRFTRYNLSYYAIGSNVLDLPSEGNNDNMTEAPTSFRYQDYNVPSSSQWGTGIQMPLTFLPLNCDVNLIIKSQFGWTNEISYVQPYLYRVRYYKSMI